MTYSPLLNSLFKEPDESLYDTVENHLANGQDPNAASKHAETPLWQAFRRGRLDVFALLLDHGAAEASSPCSSNAIGSPLGCTLGGKMVCAPVERISTNMMPSLVANWVVSGIGLVIYRRWDRGLPFRPNTQSVFGKKASANLIASGASRSISIKPPEGSPSRTPIFCSPPLK